MRWLSTLTSTIIVTIITYFWAVPYFGRWFGLSNLPLEKQGQFIATMMGLVVVSSCLIAFLRRPTIMFTVMSGGAGMGAVSLMSLALKTSGQPVAPNVLQGGAIIGALIGFCLALGAALTTLLVILILEHWLIPKFLHSPERVLDNTAQARTAPPRRSPRTQPMSPGFKWALVLLAGILLIPIMKKVDWPLFGKPSHNPHYKLTPSVWEGTISYKNAEYAFTLVFEEVGPNGSLIGHMDWPPQDKMAHYRLVVEGTANGNHLEFEDTDFIVGARTEGVYDKKDVWISGNRMVGTDKNGTATLQARRIPSSIPPPSAMTAVAFREKKNTFAVSWGKHMRLCEDLGKVEQGRWSASCWKELAKDAKELSFCARTTEPRDQLSCHIDVVWQTGDWSGCQDLGYSAQIDECLEAAVTTSGQTQVCESYKTQSNQGGFATCQAVAKRDPEACAKVQVDEHYYYPSKCWSQLAIALKTPNWCEQLPPQFKSACYGVVKLRLIEPRADYIRTAELDHCQTLRSPIEQDLCHLKLITRGAQDIRCSRIQNEKLQGTCTAIQSL
jgi:hypothetical protein